jgi:excisionase family DNA binding protein
MYEKPLGIKEAMEFTGYSKSYLYKLIFRGQIPCHKPLEGKKSRVFFKPSELADFIYRNKKAADYELSEKADDILNGEARGDTQDKAATRS